jgi:hypothetical protein
MRRILKGKLETFLHTLKYPSLICLFSAQKRILALNITRGIFLRPRRINARNQEDMDRKGPAHILHFHLLLSGFVVAFAAINRFVAARLKGDFRLFAALSTGGGKHLTGASIPKSTTTTTTRAFIPSV